MDSEGWVLIHDLTQCMYFSDFTEKELTSLMSLSNKSKHRYDIRKSPHGDMVRATWRDAEALHPRAKADPPTASPESTTTHSGRTQHLTFGVTSPISSTPSSAIYESPMVKKATSPSDSTLRATATEFRPMSAYYTPVAGPARPPLDFTPTPLRQNLFAGAFAPGYHVPVPRAFPSPWSEKSSLLASFNLGVRMATDRYAAITTETQPCYITPSDGRITCSRYRKNAETHLANKFVHAPSTPSRPQRGSRVKASCEGIAQPADTCAELRVDCSSLTGGRSATSDEIVQLARESLLAAGFEADDILSTRLNDERTACFIKVSIGEATTDASR